MNPVPEEAAAVTGSSVVIDARAATKATRRRGGVLDLLARTLRLNQARAGLVAFGLIVALALLGPFVSPHDPNEILAEPYALAGQDGLVFGADYLGRDVLSRVLHGGWAILIMALVATTLGIAAGALIGLTTAYRAGVRGEVTMRVLDVLLSFPPLIIGLLFVSIVGPKLWLLVLVVAGSYMPRVARVIHSATLQVVTREFVAYATGIGVRRWRILLGDVLPNVVAPLTVEFGLRLCWSIGLIASFSFLGLGRQPPAADWGTMIDENQPALTIQPWPVLLPIIAIAVLTIGTNLFVDGVARSAAGIDRGIAKEKA